MGQDRVPGAGQPLREAERGSWQWKKESRHVPNRGPRAEAGPRGDETEDARGCDLLHTELPHLRGPAASHTFYPKETGQHMKMNITCECMIRGTRLQLLLLSANEQAPEDVRDSEWT